MTFQWQMQIAALIAVAVPLTINGVAAAQKSTGNDEGTSPGASSGAATSRGPSLEEGGRLDLMCLGAGSANKLDVVTGNSSTSGSFMASDGTFGSYSGSGTANAYVPRSQDFEDQVNLFIEAGEGRVRMPRTMLPPLHGGEKGWFKLKNIQIGRDEITASVAINVLNSPKLRVDRTTGMISISGKAGDYSGRCRRYQPADAQRQF